MFDLESVLCDLESTYVRISLRSLVICSGFRRFCEERRGLGEQLISGIDRVCPVWPGIGAGELGIDTCANRSRFFYYCYIFLRLFFAVFCFKATRAVGEKHDK